MTRFVCVFDAGYKIGIGHRLWHFTEDTEPHGCNIRTSCERRIIFPSEGCAAFNIVDFSELEMHASSIFCPQCSALGKLAFDQLRYDTMHTDKVINPCVLELA